MIEDHGVSGVLEALADCLERKAQGLLRRNHGRCTQGLTCERQAKALRAQASALAERSYNDEDPYRFHEPFRIEWEDAF